MFIETFKLFSADHRQQATCFAVEFFLAAIRKKQIGAFHRAERRDVNIFRQNSFSQKLFSVGEMQINQRVTVACRRKKFFAFGKFFRKISITSCPIS